MIIDTTNDELLINGQRWQRGGYLQATAYATDQINITARDGRVIGKALQWDAIYDQDKNLFGLNRDGVVTALTTVFNSRVKSPYNLEALRDVQDGTASYGDLLIWSAPGEWQYDTLTQYHHAYNSEAATLRAGATATTELYYTAQADGDGLSESAQSNTPAEGYQIVRKLYYAEAAQADPDTGTWVQFADLDPNTTYASAKATLLAYLKERTGGTVPISLKMTWEEVEAFDGLLDTYGGAAAAYSVRRLSSSYTGSLIQVERASDNTTQDIGYDSNGDLDTAAIATFCSGTTCGVRVWYDQSGNSNDATQTTFANQPTIYTGGAVVTQNGNPHLHFFDFDTLPIEVDFTNAHDLYSVLYSDDDKWIYLTDQAGTGAAYGFVVDSASTSTQVNSSLLVGGSNTGYSAIQNTQSFTVSTRQTGFQYLYQKQSIFILEDIVTTVPLRFFNFRDNATWITDNYLAEVIAYPATANPNRSGIETNINDYFGIYTPFTTGLLDDYGGAAAAYSLRRLSSTYTGDAIRVRRASDNAEQDIGFDIEGNLNTAALASFCSGTDGFVKTWYDQSGNGNDAVQATTSAQPQIVSSGSFIGALDTGYFGISTAPITAAPISLAMVAEHTNATNFNMWNANEQGTNTNYFYARSDSNNSFDAAIYGGSFVRSRATLSAGEFLGFAEFLVDGSNITAQAFANGTSASIVNTTAPTGIDVNDIGQFQRVSTAYYLCNNMKELVIWNSDQSSNRTGIESNINTFYSIY